MISILDSFIYLRLKYFGITVLTAVSTSELSLWPVKTAVTQSLRVKLAWTLDVQPLVSVEHFFYINLVIDTYIYMN